MIYPAIVISREVSLFEQNVIIESIIEKGLGMPHLTYSSFPNIKICTLIKY